MPLVMTMDMARFLATGRASPRFRECASRNRQHDLTGGNVLDLKASECKLKHLLGDALMDSVWEKEISPLTLSTITGCMPARKVRKSLRCVSCRAMLYGDARFYTSVI